MRSGLVRKSSAPYSQALSLLSHVAVAGDHDDRNQMRRRIALDPAAQFISGNVGNIEIEQNQIGRSVGDARQRFSSIAGQIHVAAVGAQSVPQKGSDGRVVVHDQHTRTSGCR